LRRPLGEGKIIYFQSNRVLAKHSGSLHVTFAEGTCGAWLHDLLKPHVTEVLVCDPGATHEADGATRKLLDLLAA
jgi:hypothetical protein